ncbi:vWA domain-containing protein [Effusibacillus consociatus]|uniref:VWA domain-containing protein n=1 Tax=Effusibacillus consociatus TaxID=1117041 RepID=A0ABV9Q0H7_9BACL
MWEQVELKQILLITDGCSNIGGNPVHAAEVAREHGIGVNVIGIVDGGSLRSSGEREVREIAAAGGGMSRIVEMRQLAQTMHMMTRYTMQMTIQQAVNKELRAIVGSEMTDLPPDKRMEIARVIDQAGEEAELRLVLLVDVSASMNDKLPQVRDAIRDLEIGLDARKGKHQVAVMTYPSAGGVAKIVSQFCERPGLTALSSELTASGGTPTGPALEQALSLFVSGKERLYGSARSYVV